MNLKSKLEHNCKILLEFKKPTEMILPKIQKDEYFIPNLNTEFVDSEIMNQLSYKVINKNLDEENFVFQGNIKKGIQDTILLLNQAMTL